jgi:crotonobetainyl-CoA:carnitine CoA-transferase CaiB-like acyl-CoA transferase
MRNGIYSIGMDVSTRLGLGRMAPPWPRTRPPNPLMNLYRASDDRWFWLVGAESERHWPVILNAIGMESLGDDPDFATPRDRRRNASRLVECLDAIFATRGRDEWAQEFAAHDVWWAPVQSVEELLTDPQAEACGAFVSVPGAEDAARSVATPVDFSLTPVGPSGPSPGIGADSDRLLDSIGIGAEQRMSMRARGILPESAEVQDGR